MGLVRAGVTTDLQAAGVDDFVADGALHQTEAELLLLRVHRVLLARLAARKTHRRVRQHRLDTDRERDRWVRQVAIQVETQVERQVSQTDRDTGESGSCHASSCI